MVTDRNPGGLFMVLALMLALAAIAPARAADGPPPVSVSASYFVRFDTQPWLLACEWTDAAGKSRRSWTEGLARPDDRTVPADALCTKVKRYSFPGDHNFLYAGFQKARPTPVQTGHLTNLMYVLSGRGHNMVDGQTIDSGPGDLLAQMGDKPHQSVALTDDYAQFDVIGLPTLAEGQGFKMNDADIARGNLIRHEDAAKAKEEICLGDLTDGHYRRVTGTPPAGTPCYMAFPVVTRPAARIVEVSTTKGTVTQPHKEGVDRVYYILKGSIKDQVGDEKATVKAGDAIFHVAGTLHAEAYLSDCTFLEISFPNLQKAP